MAQVQDRVQEKDKEPLGSKKKDGTSSAQAGQADDNADEVTPPINHPFFQLRPGYEFYYTREWNTDVPDQTLIRRHNKNGSVDDIFKREEGGKSVFLFVDRHYYRVKDRNLEVALGIKKEGGTFKQGDWDCVVPANIGAGDSWETKPHKGILTVCSLETTGKYQEPSPTLASYRGRKLITIREERSASGAATNDQPVVWERVVNGYVEGLGLVEHRSYRAYDNHLAYTERLIEVKKSQ